MTLPSEPYQGFNPKIDLLQCPEGQGCVQVSPVWLGCAPEPLEPSEECCPCLPAPLQAHLLCAGCTSDLASSQAMTLCQNHLGLSFIDWVTSGLQRKWISRSQLFPGVTDSGQQTLPPAHPSSLCLALSCSLPPTLGFHPYLFLKLPAT